MSPVRPKRMVKAREWAVMCNGQYKPPNKGAKAADKEVKDTLI